MGWLKAIGGVSILLLVTVTLAVLVWVAAKIGMIFASFAAGLLIGYVSCGITHFAKK